MSVSVRACRCDCPLPWAPLWACLGGCDDSRPHLRLRSLSWWHISDSPILTGFQQVLPDAVVLRVCRGTRPPAPYLPEKALTFAHIVKAMLLMCALLKN